MPAGIPVSSQFKSVFMPPTPDKFAWARFPRRLNLGCGTDKRDGYLNVDMAGMYEPDLAADVRDLSMLPSGHYVEILAQDVLEHLPRTSTQEALDEWNRLLETGGKLFLRVPNLEGLAKLFQLRATFADHVELMQCLFGTQAYSGDFHQASFTRILLEGYLKQSGFRPTSVETRDEWLFDVVAIKVTEVDRSWRDSEAQLLAESTDDTFVNAAFRVLLSREPDVGGRNFFMTALRSSQLTRKEVIKIIKGSPEYHSLHAKG
jgi:predicted SAM-dependent methyltransferase